MAIAFVSSVTNQSKTAGTQINLLAIYASTAGNTLFAFVAFDNLTATTPTVTSISKHPTVEPNDWVKLASFDSPQAAAGGGVRGELWRLDTTGSASVNYTVTLSGSVTARTLTILQFSGVGPANLYSGSSQSGTINTGLTISNNTNLQITGHATESPTAPTFASGSTPTATISIATSGGATATNVATSMGYQIGVFKTAGSSSGWNGVIDGGSVLAQFDIPVTATTYQVSGTVAVATNSTGYAKITGAVIPAPHLIANCVMALEATDVPVGPVTAPWPDRSPAANDMVPVGGASPLGQGTNVALSTLAWMASTNHLPMTGNAPFHLIGRINTKSVGGSFMGWGTAGNGSLVDLWNYDPGALIWHGYGPGFDTIAGAPALTPNVWHTIELSYDGAGKVQVYVDNLTPGVRTGASLTIGSAALWLGQGRYNPNSDFSLERLFIYSRVLDVDERDSVRAYVEAAPAVTYQVSGSVAVTTAATGAATLTGVTYQVSGTAAVATNATGTISRNQPVSGSVPVVIGATGTVSAALKVAGTAPVVIGTTGAVTARLQTSGTAPVAVGVTGNVTVNSAAQTYQVSGTVPVVVGATGATTVVSGAQTFQVSGSVAVVTNATGAIASQSLAVSGTAPVVTNATGTVRRIQPVSGSAPVVIGASGAVTANLRAAGTAPVVVGVTGDVTVVGPPPIQVSGTVAVVTNATGAVGAQTLAVSGTVPVVTTVAGSIGSQSLAVSGSVPVVTQASGAISRVQQVSGTVAVNTAASGTVSARLPVSGVVPVVVGASGAPASTQGVSGTVAVVTSASGNVFPTGGMSGTVPVVVGVTGSVTSKQGVSGTPAAVTVGVSGTVTSRQAVAGTTPVTVGVSGAVQINPRGRVDVVVGVSGTVSQTLQVSGTVAVATNSNGSVTAQLPTSGTVPVVTTASGNATVSLGSQQYQVSGTVAVVTTTTGTITKRSQVVGTVAVVVGASGTVASRIQVSGVTPVTVQALGDLSRRTSASGTVAVVTGVTGFIYVPDPPPFPCDGLTLTPSGLYLPLSGQGMNLTLHGEAVTLPPAETPEGYSVTKTAGQLTLEGVC